MTHIEGVLKEVQLDDSGRTIICKLAGYDGHTYEFGFSTEELLAKTLKNEKAGIILYEDGSDYVSIRGVVKNLELTSKYSHNF